MDRLRGGLQCDNHLARRRGGSVEQAKADVARARRSPKDYNRSTGYETRKRGSKHRALDENAAGFDDQAIRHLEAIRNFFRPDIR